MKRGTLALAIATAATIVTACLVTTAHAEDAVDHAIAERHLLWGDKLVDLGEVHVIRDFPAERAAEVLYDGPLAYRLIGDQKIIVTRLTDGGLVRDLHLVGPARRLFFLHGKLFSVEDKIVEVIPMHGQRPATTVEFLGRDVWGAAPMREALAVLLSDGSIYWVDGSNDGGDLIVRPDPKRPTDPHRALLVGPSELGLACRIYELGLEYDVTCVNREGVTIWHRRIAHSELSVVDGEQRTRRLLYLRQTGARHLLFGSTPGAARPRSLLIQADSGETLLDVPRAPGALVEGIDGVLIGLLSSDDAAGTLSLLQAGTGKALWEVPGSERGAATAVAARGRYLIVAVYNPNACGADLFALDIASGERLWKGAVVDLNVGHSKYANRVTVQFRADYVLMEGRESAGDYIQVFDVATGARRFVDIHRHW